MGRISGAAGLSELPRKTREEVSPAFDFALEQGGDGARTSALVSILSELRLDTPSLIAACLYRLPEERVPSSIIESRFGPEVAGLVENLRSLSRLSLYPGEGQAESLRRMLMTMAQDIRVVYIKLGERLEDLNHLEEMPPEEAKFAAQEALEIYAPLAHRLGIWWLKCRLEDRAFGYLKPEEFRHIEELISQRFPLRERLLDRVAERLRRELERAGVEAELSGRVKHIYSIYTKLKRYARMGKSFEDVHDVLALRVIVSGVAECYTALGIVHSLWHPLPGEFNDYIANPKDNGYRSLHTTVLYRGTPLEIQIRTREMHWVAEYGWAAHWQYKEGRPDIYEYRIAWLRQLLEWHRELKGSEFVEAIKTDLFPERVFVFTPKGEIKEFPAGATPLDFAYSIHTELGHRCLGARVNGRMVPLNYELRNGDTVEIIVSKKAKGPSRDWLDPAQGYVRTPHAREKIKHWFRRQEREKNIRQGRELLEKEFHRLGLPMPGLAELARLFNYRSEEDFLCAIGSGELPAHQVPLKVEAPQPAEPPPPPEAAEKPLHVPALIKGMDSLLIRLARCCRPVFGDPIIGYITRSRGITIHRQDCYNILYEDEKERLIPVEWGGREALYPVRIVVRVWDRVGLLRDVTSVIAEEKVNILSVTSRANGDHTHSIYLTLEIKDLEQLGRLLNRVEGVKGVISARRESG